MISNEGLSGSMFGTGRLLDDSVQFVYSGQGCRLLLMGDTAGCRRWGRSRALPSLPMP